MAFVNNIQYKISIHKESTLVMSTVKNTVIMSNLERTIIGDKECKKRNESTWRGQAEPHVLNK